MKHILILNALAFLGLATSNAVAQKNCKGYVQELKFTVNDYGQASLVYLDPSTPDKTIDANTFASCKGALSAGLAEQLEQKLYGRILVEFHDATYETPFRRLPAKFGEIYHPNLRLHSPAQGYITDADEYEINLVPEGLSFCVLSTSQDMLGFSDRAWAKSMADNYVYAGKDKVRTKNKHVYVNFNDTSRHHIFSLLLKPTQDFLFENDLLTREEEKHLDELEIVGPANPWLMLTQKYVTETTGHGYHSKEANELKRSLDVFEFEARICQHHAAQYAYEQKTDIQWFLAVQSKLDWQPPIYGTVSPD